MSGHTENNSSKQKHIAIIGAGMGGLMLARLLQMQGLQVKVYERDMSPHVRVQGATLDLHEESGLKAMQAAGLMDAFKASYRPNAGRVRLLDKHAQLIIDQHDCADFEETRPEIDRGPLRAILLASLLPDTVVWNSHFEAMQAQGEEWQIDFQSGASIHADIVIAADGANSKVRPYITGIKPVFAGLTAIEGVVHDAAVVAPALHALLKDGKIFAVGDDRSLILSAKGDGSLSFYAGFKSDEYWQQQCGIDRQQPQQSLHWFIEAFPGWSPLWHDLFLQARYPLTIRPQYCMPADQAWSSQGNLTMLGDAAHLMPPYAGEGANMAMLDALELSICLGTLQYSAGSKLIAEYEQAMRQRAAVAASMTLASMAALHSPQALPFMSDILLPDA